MSKTSEKVSRSDLDTQRTWRGSWTHSAKGACVAYRFIDYAGYRFGLLGFRLVEVLDEFDQDTSRNHNTIKTQ